jgi:hypothetical protein
MVRAEPPFAIGSGSQVRAFTSPGAGRGSSYSDKPTCSLSRRPVRIIKSVNAALREANRPRNAGSGKPDGENPRTPVFVSALVVSGGLGVSSAQCVVGC